VGEGQVRQEVRRLLTQGEEFHTRRDVLQTFGNLAKGAVLANSDAASQQLQKGIAGFQSACRSVLNPVGEVLKQESTHQKLGKLPKALWKLGEMSPVKWL
jgi:hypothetical protein